MYVILEKPLDSYIKFMFSDLNLLLLSPLENELDFDRPMGKPISFGEWLKQNNG